MSVYKITIERIDGQSSNGYNIETKLYQQTVEGDDTIIPVVVDQVLGYISTNSVPPIIEKGEI